MLEDLGFVELYAGQIDLPHPKRMTAQGHEFIDNARNEEAWRVVTEKAASKAGGVGLSVLTALLAAWAKKTFGLD